MGRLVVFLGWFIYLFMADAPCESVATQQKQVRSQKFRENILDIDIGYCSTSINGMKIDGVQ